MRKFGATRHAVRSLAAIATAWSCLALGACHGPKQYLKSEPGAPLLEYARTMCFGPCPAFELEVDSEGHARFNGRVHIQPEGRHTGTWSKETLHELAQMAHDLRLDEKAGTYDNPRIMDLPSTRLAMGSHRVLDRINGPDLTALYTRLDSLISVTDWTPVMDGTKRGQD